jgi:large subunit ribosomal protein L20
MVRVKNGIQTHKKHKKLLKMAKGYYGRSNNCYTIAVRKVHKGLTYAYRDRKNKKRTMRSLWIQRLNAAVRAYGISYSRFIDCLVKAGVVINRKMLSNLAIQKHDVFEQLVKKVISN